MARITSNIPFDITGVDFFWYNQFRIDSDVEKDVDVVYNGISYPDIAWVEGREQIGDQVWHYELTFGGHSLTSSDGLLTGGRITGFIETNLGTGELSFAVDQIDIAATAASSVFSTESTADEIELLLSLLGGDDEFNLSEFDDHASGLGGNDVMRGAGGDDHLSGDEGDDRLDGGAGDDVLDGGAGTDTAVFAGARSDYEVIVGEDGVEVISTAEGTDWLSNIEFLEFNGVSYSIAELETPSEPPPPPPPAVLNEFTLVAVSGFIGAAGGEGRVVGSAGLQDITVANAPGIVQFDASFNRGGDIIRLSGDASDYMVWSSSSSVIIDDGDTQIAVPVGPVGADIVFDDGVRTITYSSEAGLRLGEQVVTTSPAAVSSPAGDGTVDGGGDPSVQGRLIVTEDATAVSGGNLRVIGTFGAETVSLLAGSSVVFDASFNRGGDTIILSGSADDYTAVVKGSLVEISSGSTEVTLPVGLNAITVQFDDGEYGLFVDQELGGAVLGDTLLGNDPLPFADETPVAVLDLSFA